MFSLSPHREYIRNLVNVFTYFVPVSPYENKSNDKSRNVAHFFYCWILRACNSILHKVATYTLLDQVVKNKLIQS